jgi:hypothetical protein
MLYPRCRQGRFATFSFKSGGRGLKVDCRSISRVIEEGGFPE